MGIVTLAQAFIPVLYLFPAIHHFINAQSRLPMCDTPVVDTEYLHKFHTFFMVCLQY
jgi:hypothetical protein